VLGGVISLTPRDGGNNNIDYSNLFVKSEDGSFSKYSIFYFSLMCKRTEADAEKSLSIKFLLVSHNLQLPYVTTMALITLGCSTMDLITMDSTLTSKEVCLFSSCILKSFYVAFTLASMVVCADCVLLFSLFLQHSTASIASLMIFWLATGVGTPLQCLVKQFQNTKH
jgi:hypothetical protein